MKLNTKVLLAQPINEKGMAMLREAVEEIVVAPDSQPETLLSLLDDKTEGVIVRYNVFNDAMFEKAPNLKVVARHGIGVELIDLESATRHGVIVTNTPDAATSSVAEHVVMMILMLGRRVRFGENLVRNGLYKNKDKYGPDDVEGKTVGFIGLGRIGSAAARRCQGLGLEVVAYDPYLPADKAAELGITMIPSFEEVLKMSDFVSLHTPLTPETKHMISDAQLAMMKPDAYLINCARGAVVDEEALIRALQSGTIAGAGLDVFESEPPKPDNPLFKMDNVVVTPHSSSLTKAGSIRMACGAADQLIKVLSGQKPDWVVNKDVLK